jgi:Flp pilus assembly protein TadG
MQSNPDKKQTRRGKQGGNTILEFALVMVFLVPMFAGSFTIGMALAKDIQVSNVARDAVVLMVRAATDPESGLDLSQTQNQRIIVAAASGLGMNSDAQQDPNPSGSAVVFLSKVVMVGPNECSLGVIPAPSGVPTTTGPNYGWTSSNCPNYGTYAFEYRVVIGNGTRWSSTLGAPPSGTVLTNGTISAQNIATNTAEQVTSFPTITGMTLSPSVFALVSEMYADVSFLNFFSILGNPTLYARSIS